MKNIKKIIVGGGIVVAVAMLAALSPLSLNVPQSMAATVISTGGLKAAVMSLASFYKLQKYEYVDDATTTNKYTAEDSTFITAAGSPFCTGAGCTALNLNSGIVKVDLATGLWWTDRTASTTDNNFVLTPDNNTGVPVGGNSIAVCTALNTANFGGHNDWYLPTQKQLMQVYIDGSNYNLPNTGDYFWSSTEYSSNPAGAWAVSLGTGFTYSLTKVTLLYVRCVRP